MRGWDMRMGELFSYGDMDLEERMPGPHPLRLIRSIVNEVLAGVDRDLWIAAEKSYLSCTNEIAPEPTGHGLPLGKCEAYNRVYDQCCGSS